MTEQEKRSAEASAQGLLSVGIARRKADDPTAAGCLKAAETIFKGLGDMWNARIARQWIELQGAVR